MQTAGAWALDHVKGTVLSACLTIAGALIVYAAMAHAPAVWWLVSGAVFAVLFVGLANLAPVLLLPIFFTFKPLERDALRGRLEQLAARAGTRIVGVYEWALGTRTRKANAALAGLGNTRRILVSDTMLDQYSDDEIEVVLAHELGHHVHHDIWRGLALEIALILLGCFAADWGLRRLGPLVGLEGLADPAGVPLVAAAAGAVSLVLLPFGLALSRRHERRADRFALDLTKNPNAFVTAMRRLGAQNLAEEQPSRIVQWLFHSHPPLEERLAAARAWREPHLVRRPSGLPARLEPAFRPARTACDAGLQACHSDAREQRAVGAAAARSCGAHSVPRAGDEPAAYFAMRRQLALHFLAALVLLQVAVEPERARAIGAELERDGWWAPARLAMRYRRS